MTTTVPGWMGRITEMLLLTGVLCACGTTPPATAPANPGTPAASLDSAPPALETPSTAPSRPAPSTPAAPTPVPAPSGIDAGSPIPVEQLPPAALELVCPGGDMMSAAIDYAADAPGVANILDATRALEGVTILDQVVQVDETTTVIVRGGQAVWRGDWFKGSRGYLLGGTTSCANTTIGLGGG